MKYIIIVITALLLAGCGKVSDMVATEFDGYVVRCIDGTKYVLMTSERGLAITPHVGTDGKPKGCQ